MRKVHDEFFSLEMKRKHEAKFDRSEHLNMAFKELTRKSEIAKILEDLYTALCSNGSARVDVGIKYNYAMPLHLNFTLPHKMFNPSDQKFFLNPNIAFQMAKVDKNGKIIKLKPFHSILLLEKPEDLKNEMYESKETSNSSGQNLIWTDSPLILRFLNHVDPTKTLEEIACNADMPLLSAFRI